LWNWSSPTVRASAAYTDLPHLGHFGVAGALKGIVGVVVVAQAGQYAECNAYKVFLRTH